jgi:SAM-dependent methyltransferase
MERTWLNKLISETRSYSRNRRHSKLAAMIDDRIEKNSKVLEVGCGSATSLVHLSERGHSCVGVEPAFNQWEAIRDKDIKIYQDVFNNVRFTERFDVVVLEHLLEHMPNPVDFLLQINSLMAKNGLLLVEIPNSKNYYSIRTMGGAQDEHLFYYNSENLARLLRKCGFMDINTLTYDCGDIQLDWVINRLMPNKKPKIYTGYHSIKIRNEFARRYLTFIFETLFKYIYIKITKGGPPFYVQNERNEGLWILSFSSKADVN